MGVLVEFLTPSGTDAPEFAKEIGDVFHDAGWNVTQPTGALVTMTPAVHGLAIEVETKADQQSVDLRQQGTL
jgi:hypothetical protein